MRFGSIVTVGLVIVALAEPARAHDEQSPDRSHPEESLVPPEMLRELMTKVQVRIAFHEGFMKGREAQGNRCNPERKEPPVPNPEKPGEPDEEDDSEKVAICHIPRGNPARAHTIKVGSSAVDAHLAHGDTLGECADENLKEPAQQKPGKKPADDSKKGGKRKRNSGGAKRGK